MSVLFKALYRASQDYRNKKYPIVVPLLPVTTKPACAFKARVWTVAFVVAFSIGALAIWLFPRTAATQTQAVSVPVSYVQPAEVRDVYTIDIAERMSVPQSLQSKTVMNEEPQGISLPVDSKTVPPLEEKAQEEQLVVKEKEETGTETDRVNKAEKASFDEKTAKTSKSQKNKPRIIVTREKTQASSDLLRKAREFMEEKRYDDAVAMYDKALLKDGNDQAAWEGKVYALQQSDKEEALLELRKMAELRPFSASVHAAEAQIMMRRGDYKAALAKMRRAVDIDGSNKNYRLALAILYDRMGLDSEALTTYRQIPPPLPYAVQRRVEYLSAQALPGGSHQGSEIPSVEEKQ